MLQAAFQRFSGSCMMLMHSAEEEARFCGTAFLVHEGGYLLSSSECVEPAEDLVAVPVQPGGEFTDVTLEEVAPIPLEVVRKDSEHAIALLRFVPDMNIGVPDHILGNPGRTELGSTVMSLGFSFGHNRLHNLVALGATLSSKIQSPSGARLLLFDTLIHYGDRGGPLVDARDARIIGINSGPFDPVEIWRDEHHRTATVPTSLSYAYSIEYGVALLEAEGITVI